MAMVAEWTVWTSVILDYQTPIVWSVPWFEISAHCRSSLFSRLRERDLPSHVCSVLESFDHSPGFGRLICRRYSYSLLTGNTVVLLSIFPRRISSIASMSDTMEVDSHEPRGTKRTADEAGLPREAPRRIKPLDKDVVNKIAAGEIIVAPMHALVSSLYD